MEEHNKSRMNYPHIMGTHGETPVHHTYGAHHGVPRPEVPKKDQTKKFLVWGLIAIAAIALLASGNFEFEPSNLAADGVDLIPEINLEDCMSQIRAVNPEMSDQDANDNCYTIEAVNQKDSSICGRVSGPFRPNCLAQFQ